MARPVDAAPLMTMTALAAHLGLTKQAVSKAVKALDAAGHALPVQRDNRGRVKLIDVAAFKRLRGLTVDSVKARPAAPADAPRGVNPDSLDGARFDKLQTDIQLGRIRLQAEAGQLVRRDLYEEAIARLGEEIVRIVDVTAHVDDMDAARDRGGLQAFRVAAKAATHKMRSKIADALAAAALVAPERDDPLKEAEAAEA
jgi:hypothetical protein